MKNLRDHTLNVVTLLFALSVFGYPISAALKFLFSKDPAQVRVEFLQVCLEKNTPEDCQTLLDSAYE